MAAYIERRGGPRYDGRREIVITCGEGEAMLDALFCLTDPGDEVILTDPTYAGMLNRVRLVGAVAAPGAAARRAAASGASIWRRSGPRRADRTRVVFVNNASFPTGWVASDEEWEAIAALCRERDLWLLYWAGFEGVLFDGRPVRHPAALPGMRDRTVTVGAPSFEQRMIAWRVGWVVAPGELVNDVSRVQIYNGLVSSGFAQIGTRVALAEPPGDLAAANAEWQRRRDETLRQLAGLPAVRPAGAWSLAPRRGDARPRPRGGISPVARGEGRGHAHAWLGRRGRGSPRPVRLQQRAGRTAHHARGACPAGAGVRSRRDVIRIGARLSSQTPRPASSQRDYPPPAA